MKSEVNIYPFYTVKELLPRLLPGVKRRRYVEGLKKLQELGIPYKGHGTNHLVLYEDIVNWFREEDKHGTYKGHSTDFAIKWISPRNINGIQYIFFALKRTVKEQYLHENQGVAKRTFLPATVLIKMLTDINQEFGRGILKPLK